MYWHGPLDLYQGSLRPHTKKHFSSVLQNTSSCCLNSWAGLIHCSQWKERLAWWLHLSFSSDTRTLLSESPRPKSPKEHESVWQNRAVTACLHRDRAQILCLSFFPPYFLFISTFLTFICPLCLASILSIYIFPFPPKSPSLLSCSFAPSLLSFVRAVHHGLETAPCSAHVLLHVASSSCVAAVWTPQRQSDLC